MIARRLHLLVLVCVTAGCEIGQRPESFVIAGPTVPNPRPTVAPYVWDSADELAIWINNPVAKGSAVLKEVGNEAFISIERADSEWVLRGPDLVPPVTGVQTLRIRYRWRLDPSLSANASRKVTLTAYFQTVAPIGWYDPTDQAAASAFLDPQDDWAEFRFIPWQYGPPIDVRYCYLHSFGANRGVLEIDRIELVQ